MAIRWWGLAVLGLVCGLAAGAGAQEAENNPTDPLTEGAAADPGLGAVTRLPVPRYVSLKSSEGNVRRGPSLEHRIDWVFRHYDMPLRVTAEFEHWRRVEDNEGQGGWIYYTLLSGVRTVLVTQPKTELHMLPSPKSALVAVAEEGVIGKLGTCETGWCEISAGGQDGWVQKSQIWGVDPDEIRD
ncbi:MAG: SH3 domain-containing protein [Rhodobacteraceae bacterium]|nr:SH3 domain-containing protein [Paracoccaceae bacterium]